MVRLIHLALAAVAAAMPSMAHIAGFNTTTKAVSAGETIDVSFYTLNYITQYAEYYAAFGLNSQYDNTLGTYLEHGIDLQKAPHTETPSPRKYVTYKLKLPDPLPQAVAGEKTVNFTAVIFGAVGASGGATSRFFQTKLHLKQ